VLAAAESGFLLGPKIVVNTVSVWEVETGKHLLNFKTRAVVTSAAFSPDSKLLALATGFNETEVIVVEAGSGKELWIARDQKSDVRSLVFSPDSKAIASGSYGGAVILWDVGSGQKTRVFERAGDSHVYSLCFLPDGKILVAGDEYSPQSRTYTFRAWKLENDKKSEILQGHRGQVATFISADGKTLTSTDSFDGTTRLWDTVGGREIHVIRGPQSQLLTATLSPDGKLLACNYADGTCLIWDLRIGRQEDPSP
jgi:WD40 repeat protein